MKPPRAPIWRLLLACLPRLTRRAPFIRIPLFEAEERRQRNQILRDPRAALLGCETMGDLSTVAHVLQQRGIDWRKVIGEQRAADLLVRLAHEMRDDGSRP